MTEKITERYLWCGAFGSQLIQESFAVDSSTHPPSHGVSRFRLARFVDRDVFPVTSHPGRPGASDCRAQGQQSDGRKDRKRIRTRSASHNQYVNYVEGIVQLDFGRSFTSRKPVSEDLARYLPATLELGYVRVSPRHDGRCSIRGALCG